MKRAISVMVLLLLAAPAFAQPAPMRAGEVAAFAAQHRDAFGCQPDPDVCKLARCRRSSAR